MGNHAFGMLLAVYAMLNNSNNLNNLDPSFVIPVIKQSIAFSLDRFQISSAAQQDTKKSLSIRTSKNTWEIRRTRSLPSASVLIDELKSVGSLLDGVATDRYANVGAFKAHFGTGCTPQSMTVETNTFAVFLVFDHNDQRCDGAVIEI